MEGVAGRTCKETPKDLLGRAERSARSATLNDRFKEFNFGASGRNFLTRVGSNCTSGIRGISHFFHFGYREKLNSLFYIKNPWKDMEYSLMSPKINILYTSTSNRLRRLGGRGAPRRRYWLLVPLLIAFPFPPPLSLEPFFALYMMTRPKFKPHLNPTASLKAQHVICPF